MEKKEYDETVEQFAALQNAVDNNTEPRAARLLKTVPTAAAQ